MVTIEVRGAWHYGMAGTLVKVGGGIATVRFDGHGTVRVPAALVRAL